METREKVKIRLIIILKDSFGDSLLHYVAAAMDEEAIFKVVQWEIFLNLHFCNVSNGNEVIFSTASGALVVGGVRDIVSNPRI